MSALGITWANKINGGNPKLVHEEQWWFEDANEVKNAINDHKALLDQFTFSSPLDGNVFLAGNFGVGGASTGAKLFAQATAGGQQLFALQTFSGVPTLQANDDGSVWNRGVSGNAESTSFGFLCAVNNLGLSYTGYGYASLLGNQGDRVTGVGVTSLSGNQGDDAVGVGYNTLRLNRGDRNTGIGNFSGESTLVGELLGSDDTFLGYGCTFSDVNISNATAVGANITLSQSNSVVLGDTNVTDVFAGGNGAGLNLKSPNGTNFRISVDNAGTLVIV